MDIKLEKVWKQIKEFLTETPQQTIAEISAKCKLNKKTVTDIVTEKSDAGELECAKTMLGVLFSVPKAKKSEVSIKPVEYIPQVEHVSQPEELVGEPLNLITPAEKAKLAAKDRRKPYTPISTTGFKKSTGKVTIFLERRNNAKSITFTANQLQIMLEVING